jgi:hypothetical protein
MEVKMTFYRYLWSFSVIILFFLILASAGIPETSKNQEGITFYEINSELIWFDLTEPTGSIVGVEVGHRALYFFEGYSEEYKLLSTDDFDEILSAAVGNEGLGQYLGHDGLSHHEAGRTIKTWVYRKGIVRLDLRKAEDGNHGIERFRVFFFREIDVKPESCHIVSTTIPNNIIVRLMINGNEFMALSDSIVCGAVGEASTVSAAGPLNIAYPNPSGHRHKIAR